MPKFGKKTVGSGLVLEEGLPGFPEGKRVSWDTGWPSREVRKVQCDVSDGHGDRCRSDSDIW